MIECSDEYIFKRRKNKFKKRFLPFFIVVIIITSLVLYYRFIIFQNITNICADYGYSFCIESCNQAVYNSLQNDSDYSQLVKIEKNSNNEITLISFETYKVNYLSRKIVFETEKLLKKNFLNGIPIPLCAFSGIKLLNGLGPIIQFKALSISSVDCEFNSKFSSCGINQTLHSVYVSITCDVKLNFSIFEKHITNKTNVLIAESVIVGKVPEIYLKR